MLRLQANFAAPSWNVNVDTAAQVLWSSELMPSSATVSLRPWSGVITLAREPV